MRCSIIGDMIPVFSLSRQNKIIGRQLQQAIKEVIDGGVYILGPKVEEFEKKFTDYLGVKYAVGVASGTDALSLALLTVGVEMGDEVILPANCYPSVFAVTAIGAIPQLVDIDPVTFNIDPTKIPDAITKKTKAIIAVHLYGQPTDMEAILPIGKQYKIPVIEDCAQAHGAEVSIEDFNLAGPAAHVSQTALQFNRDEALSSPYRISRSSVELRLGTPRSCHPLIKKVGSIGDVGCFSFYPTKNLGCFGDGGMVVNNNEDIYKKVKLLRMYGEEKRYKSIALGRNSRLDELQAAILLVKLKYLDKWNKRRREIAELYNSQLKFCTFALKIPPKCPKDSSDGGGINNLLHLGGAHPVTSEVVLGKVQNFSTHVYHLFVIRITKR